MLIGIDFDNTIVSYDRLFHRIALEKQLIPATLPANKGQVRDHLRQADQEDIWTSMQGEVYGNRMTEAEAFVGALDFFRFCKAHLIQTCIISHKTKTPYAGPPYDLHAAARDWLTQQAFFDPKGIGLPPERAYFELTKQAKLERIASAGCHYFIDDLPEILGEPTFPPGVHKILFDPAQLYPDAEHYTRCIDWQEIQDIFYQPLFHHL